MPHANIWIKKENEGYWINVRNKSRFVNDAIEQAKKGVPPKKSFSADAIKVDIADVASPDPSPKARKAVRQAVEQSVANMELQQKMAKFKGKPLVICKHGSHPDLCKKKPANGPCK